MHQRLLVIVLSCGAMAIPACKKKPVPPVPNFLSVAVGEKRPQGSSDDTGGPALPLTPDDKVSAPRKCQGFAPVGLTPVVTKGDGRSTRESMGFEGKIGEMVLTVGAGAPTIKNLSKNSTCTVDVSGVDGASDSIYWLNGTRRLLYRSRDGKFEHVSLVELDTCKKLWESRPLFGKVIITQSNLQINADCTECEVTGTFDGVCECYSAEVWRLNHRCGLSRIREDSDTLTRDQLKVKFRGLRKVKGAKARGALVIY